MNNSQGCQCDHCMKKIAREGFWHASNADHARASEERREMDYWTEQQLGYDPKIGRPSLDNVFERQRTPEELEHILASSRKRYPRMFRRLRLP